MSMIRRAGVTLALGMAFGAGHVAWGQTPVEIKVLTDEVNCRRALYASAGGEESHGVVMVSFPL